MEGRSFALRPAIVAPDCGPAREDERQSRSLIVGPLAQAGDETGRAEGGDDQLEPTLKNHLAALSASRIAPTLASQLPSGASGSSRTRETKNRTPPAAPLLSSCPD